MHNSKLFIILLLFPCCQTSHTDSVNVAKKLSDQSSVASREVSYFLIEAADARHMIIEEATLAKERGTTDEIKLYGELMIHDQTLLLRDITTLTNAQNIKLPETLSNEKARALKDLKDKTETQFDKKFVKMMIIDHRRDLREFEKAALFKDPQVQKLSKHYEPIIQSHLDLAQNLKQL